MERSISVAVFRSLCALNRVTHVDGLQTSIIDLVQSPRLGGGGGEGVAAQAGLELEQVR